MFVLLNCKMISPSCHFDIGRTAEDGGPNKLHHDESDVEDDDQGV